MRLVVIILKKILISFIKIIYGAENPKENQG